MRMSQAFPSKYLKSDEVGNQRFTLTIRDVQMEDIGDNDNKPVVYFQEMQKGMVMNKTNAEMIIHLYGDETNAWIGRQVELFTAMTSFQGRSMLGLRVMAPPTAMPAHQPMQPPPPGMPNLNVPPAAAPGMPDPRYAQRPVYPAPDPNAPLPTDPQGGGGYKADPLDDEIAF